VVDETREGFLLHQRIRPVVLGKWFLAFATLWNWWRRLGAKTRLDLKVRYPGGNGNPDVIYMAVSL
jgi:hypothetical protein